MTLQTGGGIRTANLIAAGLGTDTYTNMEGIAGGSGNDNLTGSTAGDILVGNDGIDILNGAAGNDTLKGGLGNDSINGGAGVDLIDFSDASTGINFTLVQSATNTTLVSNLVGGLGNDVYLNMEGVNGSRGDDILVGSISADILQGDSGADNLSGDAGNDTLTGGGNGTIFTLITDARNFDTLTGGAGNDRFVVDSGIDNITDLGNGVDVLQVSLLATANARMNAAWTATNVTSNDGIANLSTAGFAVNLNAVVNGINGFNVTNTGGATTLTGSTLNDNLTGFTGNDTLVGGTGNDTLIGNDGNDVLNGGVGDDSMDGGMGNDLYIVSAVTQLGADAITDSGSTLGGASNVDEIRYTGTTAGNLVLSTNISGIERVVIGTGTAASAVSTGTGAININAQAVANATQTGLNIIGNAGTNNIFGTNYNDIIDGGAGIDSLNGGLGNDVLTGGLGIDTFVINGGIDSVTDLGQGGADIIRVAAGATANVTINTAWTATAASVNSGIENITTNGLAVNLALVTAGNGFNVRNNGAATTLTGSALNDTLNGGTGNDILVGGAGSDSMLGGNGNDIFIVAAVAQITGDTIDGGANTDEIRFTSATASTLTLSSNIYNVENIIIGTGTTPAAAVTTGTTALNVDASALTYGVSITGNAGANQLTGSGFADTLNGGTGNDTLIGGSGNDSLNGGAGNDSMIGGDGNDTYVVDSTTDVVVETNSVVGSGGTDLIQSSVTYTLGNNVENLTLTGTTAINGTGNALDNFITGNTGNNNLVGNDGSDTLDGGAGVDTLSGGFGNDQLTGGAGNDVFLFNTLPNKITNYDTITDFTIGDKINLSRATFTSFGANAASMAATEFINTTTANFSGLNNTQQHIIYNTDTGALYYDANSGTTSDAVQIALLGATTPHPTLTAASFAIIA
jgi:Ca2+-binding RTX toxin-like protein